MDIKVKLINGGTLPYKAHKGDACYDCEANIDVIIEPHKRAKVPLGFALALPSNFEAQIRPRSGLSSKGIDVCYGTIDYGYTGEVCAIVCNNTDETYSFRKGGRICQMAIRRTHISLQDLIDLEGFFFDISTANNKAAEQHLITENLVEVSELDSTERGENGFGSSGI